MGRFKIISIVIFVLCIASKAHAQSDAQFSQYWELPSYYNPGAAGTSDLLNIHAATRQQWVGMPGAPKTFTIMGDMPFTLFKQQHGVGAIISTEKIGKGLTIYHPTGIVVNGNAVIGENCHFHGNNCIGNSGIDTMACPVLGDNIMLGVGSKIIGDVRLANNIKVGAGAVVVSSFLEEGITIAGVPAKKIEKRG